MEPTKSIQNYQSAMEYERFMKIAYRCTQRDERRGIYSAAFHLLFHIENGYRHAGISYGAQMKRVRQFILSAMDHVELTRSIPEHVQPIWELIKLNVENSIDADYLSATIAEIRTVMKDLTNIS